MDNPSLELDLQDLKSTTTNGHDPTKLSMGMSHGTNHVLEGNNPNRRLQEIVIEEQTMDSMTHKRPNELLYGIDDVPPWYTCIFLGFQNYLEMIGATVACTFFLAPSLCMEDDDPDKANVISSLVFMSGIITLLQTTLGTRLPIVQGGSFSYLIPALAIMKLPIWQCPSAEELSALSAEEKTELWQVRMREIQGATIFAAMFEVIFAATGIIGFIFKFLTPMAVAPIITLIGISLFNSAAEEASKNYAVSISTLLLLLIFSQHLRNVKIPLPCKKDGTNPGKMGSFPIFQVYPVLLAIGLVWIVCAILTATDVLQPGDPARTDSKLRILTDSTWFRIPYPFQWGWPTVSAGAVLGLACGVMTSALESLGDYCACASIVKTSTPPVHALNRGIFMEGIGCVLGGIFGTGNGSTSYSHNIGTISVTNIASRRVVQFAGIIMLGLGLVGKAGAVFISIPDPILAGLFVFVLPLVMAVGLGTLAEVSVSSSRNMFIVSFSIFMGLTISNWITNHPYLIKTGSETADNLIQILLSTTMFVGGLIGFVLDNTIAGTREERGLSQRAAAEKAAEIAGDTTYDLPLGMDYLRRTKWFRWFPISPTYSRHPISLLPFGGKKQSQNSKRHELTTN